MAGTSAPPKCLPLWGTCSAYQHAKNSYDQPSWTVTLGAIPKHQHAHSSCSQATSQRARGQPNPPECPHKCSPATTGRSTQSTQGIHLEHLTRDQGSVPLNPTGVSYIRPLFQYWETQLIYLIHRNKHRELGKMRRQKNTCQMKEQGKTSEKELNEMEIAIYHIKSSKK